MTILPFNGYINHNFIGGYITLPPTKTGQQQMMVAKAKDESAETITSKAETITQIESKTIPGPLANADQATLIHLPPGTWTNDCPVFWTAARERGIDAW